MVAKATLTNKEKEMEMGTTKKKAAKKAAKQPAKKPAKKAATKKTRTFKPDRLPEVGTVIQKLDRHGEVRCECVVAADGIHYKKQLFKSLSSAAMAASKDLGLKSKTQNGFFFWGLSKPAPKKTE